MSLNDGKKRYVCNVYSIILVFVLHSNIYILQLQRRLSELELKVSSIDESTTSIQPHKSSSTSSSSSRNGSNNLNAAELAITLENLKWGFQKRLYYLNTPL